jgi:NAD+--asparagine ADP-ribosyltransferase
LDLRTIESRLGLSDLQEDKIDGRKRSVLERRGIRQVFRAKRFTDGKYRNFSPARALM